MKKLLLLSFCLVSFLGRAQISSYFHGDAKDFADLKTRSLIVELLEEDEKILKKLEKPKYADDLKAYKNMIKLYNEEIVLYAKKYWILNTDFEFKTQSEVETLKKSKNKSYAVLRNLRLKDIDTDFRTKLYINAFVYTRIESNKDAPDSQAYMPVFSKKSNILMDEADYKFCFDVLQSNINYIISKKKNINSENYIKEMAEGNCPLIKNKTLLVKESLIYEKTSKGACLKKYNGNLKIVSDEEVNKAFIEKEKDKVVLFSVPYEIAKGNMGPVGQSFIISYKVIVDCETGKILYLFMPKGFAVMGQNLFQFMIDKDFENIKNCK
ncbi:hypothetical protein [Flavobacterium sp.]|uniref:hypothetical protein n=1 Tax=Flavobacterium sp. TaxID=239 RepID=UPI0038FD31B7